jgi:hypothetical protein
VDAFGLQRCARIAIAMALALLGACAATGDDDHVCGDACAEGHDGDARDGTGEGAADADDAGGADADEAAAGDADAADADGSSCVPTETIEVTCNRIDDDCDGIIDDVDLGGDGICDCLGVLLLGDAGPLAASTFVAWLESRGTTAQRRLDSSGPPLAATDLAGIDVVILDRLSRDYDASEVAALQAFVRAGGGLISMTGYSWHGPDATRPNLIVAGLGAQYEVSVHLEGPVTEWLTTHPIASGIDIMTFQGGYAVTPLAGFSTTTVATTGGYAVGVAIESGDGRVFVWGDEWIEYDSEWASMPTVARLWANLFGWLVPRRCTVPIL